MSDGVTDSADLLVELHDLRPEDRRTHELLERVLAELQSLRAAVTDRERIPASRLHLRIAAPLVREISSAVGNTSWDARELLDEAVARDPALRAAILSAVGPLDAGITRRLGRLLARCEGVALNGYRIERVDDDRRDGATWRIERV